MTRAPFDPSTGAPTIWPHLDAQGDLGRARREWLHTNGAGAYASSTLAGMHTRRYHGLLVAALDPPLGRHVILSHVDAAVTLPRDPSVPRAEKEHWDLS